MFIKNVKNNSKYIPHFKVIKIDFTLSKDYFFIYA